MRIALGLIALLALTSADNSNGSLKKETDKEETAKFWQDKSKEDLKEKLSQKPNKGVAKNVVFVVGDGMGISSVTGGRIWSGQQRGFAGEESQLTFEKFPCTGLSKTYSTDMMTPDSAATGTAYLCGVKTNNKVLGVSGAVKQGDCEAALDKANQLESIFAWAQKAGKWTGFVTTDIVVGASPAAGYAHSADREWYASVPSNCSAKDIAQQLLFGEVGSQMRVILGGGYQYFLPQNPAPASKRMFPGDDHTINKPGIRPDNRNLIEEYIELQRLEKRRTKFVSTREELKAIEPSKIEKLLGLFSKDVMSFVLDLKRGIQPDIESTTQSNDGNSTQSNNGNSTESNNGNSDHTNNGNGDHSNNGNSTESNNGNSDHTNNGNGDHSNNGNSTESNNGNSDHTNNGNGDHSNNGNSTESNNGNSDHTNNGNGDHSNNGNSTESNNGNRDHTNNGNGDHSNNGNSTESNNGNSDHTNNGNGEHSNNGSSTTPSTGNGTQPDLEPMLFEMTEIAIAILSRAPNGFVLFVEGGNIDWAHHLNKAEHALEEVVQLDLAVAKVKQTLSDNDTLTVVTADHSHGFTINGYAPRERTIAGSTDSKNAANNTYRIMSYATGPGKPYPSLEHMEIGAHSAEEVPIYASGPWAHLFVGSIEESFIAEAIAYSACIGPHQNRSRRSRPTTPRPRPSRRRRLDRVNQVIRAIFKVFTSLFRSG